MGLRFKLRDVLLYTTLVATASMMACGDTSVSSNTQLTEERPEGPVGTPGVTNQYFMVANGSASLEVSAGNTAPISVFLYNKQTGNPVAEETVQYEVLEGAEFGALSALNGYTDGDGMASVNLQTGEVTGAVKIKVSHPSANALEFTVNIMPAPAGSLDVRLTNTAPTIMGLQNIDVRLYESRLQLQRVPAAAPTA